MIYDEAVCLLRSSDFKDQADLILRQSKPAVQFTRSHDEETVNCNKLGGKPSLHQSTNWPTTRTGRPLPFLCQFDLGTCAFSVPGWPLPSAGLLSFFYDARLQPDGNRLAHFGRWSVLYSPPGTERSPRELPLQLNRQVRFSPTVLRPHESLSLPSEVTLTSAGLEWCDDWDEIRWESYGTLCNRLESEVGVSSSSEAQLGGWPREIQGEMPGAFRRKFHRNGCGSMHESENPQFLSRLLSSLFGPPIPRAVETFLCKTTDWTMLLQLESQIDGPTNWMWGDFGSLYFWMSRSAMQFGNFEQVWMEMQYL